MTLVRAVAAILAALAAALAIIGFAVTQSLTQPQPFVTAMDQAIAQPAIQAEVGATIKQQILAAGDNLAGNAGPLGELARSGAEAIAGQVDTTVTSQRFALAWTQWSRLMYSGLADFAAGRPNPEVSVSGSTIDVAVGPLVEPIVGEVAAGGLTSTLQLVGRDTDVSIATAFPVEQALTAIGTVSQWRWVLAAAAVLLAAVAIFGGRRRIRWAAVTVLLTAAVTAGAWLGLLAAGSTPPPGSATPQLSVAVAQALVSPWADQLKAAALVLAVVGLALGILGLFMGRPKVGGTTGQP